MMAMVVAFVVVAAGTAFMFIRPPKPTRIALDGPARPSLDPAKGVADPTKLQELHFRPQVEHTGESTSLPKLEGTAAPAFTLPDTAGNQVSLASLTQDKPLLIFFVEKEQHHHQYHNTQLG